MKKLIVLLLMFVPFLPQTQEAFYTFDMSSFLSEMEKPWSIGNGTNQETGEFEGPYFEVVVYGGMNMNGHHLEIMNTKITVIGDTINSGVVSKRFTFISDLIVEDETLSVPIVADKKQLKMYPNPAKVYATFKGDFIKGIRIYNLSGKLVKNIVVSGNEYRLSVYDYTSGLYIIEITFDDNQKTIKKLIVQ